MAHPGVFGSSLARKYAMALTGLFLCLFLAGHLAGNLQLFNTGLDGAQKFNEYARFMTTFPAVKVLSYLTYLSVLLHIVDGILLTRGNRKARPVRYARELGSANSAWNSRNMGVLGTIILVFLVTHMQNFWYVMHFGEVPVMYTAAGDELKDLHSVVLAFFNPAKNSWALGAVVLYVAAQAALALHLLHGFESAFQSMGVRHPRYTPWVKSAGKVFSIGVPAGFAALPIYLYLSQL